MAKVLPVGAGGFRLASVERPSPLTDAVMGIVMGGVGIFLLLSLLSLAHVQPSGGRVQLPSANWGGIVGYALANGLSRATGSAAFLVPVLLCQAALVWLIHARRGQRILYGVGGLLLLVGMSPLLRLGLVDDPLFASSAGGLVGELLLSLFVPYGNVGGTLLLCMLFLALGGMLTAPPILSLAWRGAGGIQRLWMTWVKPVRARFRRAGRAHPSRPGSSPMPPLSEIDATTMGKQGPAPPVELAFSKDGEPVEGIAPEAEPTPTTAVTIDNPGAYTLPALSLLNSASNGKRNGNGTELFKHAQLLEGKLRDFGVEGHVVQVLAGPVVTVYEFEPASGIKVSRIANLADDLALGMKALSVRIVAPVPGKAVVGIEIPNTHREPVVLRDILASPAFQQARSKLLLALGKDILGTPTVTDLAQIPHLLIAGATGSGKSVGLNSMICSILFNATPEDVKFIMIDPKMLELSVYDGIPHLIAPVVTHPKKAAAALHWAMEEMERRYRLLAERGVRGIEGYNQAHPLSRLPYIVVVIDELADLMLVSHREVEDSLTRLAQMARAAGIHLLVATQRPSVDVLTGIIKANFPARISFQVSSRIDSRTILDATGAERLLGRGDMLFLPPGTSTLVRIHGAYVSEGEIKRLVDYLRAQRAPLYDGSIFAGQAEVTPEAETYDVRYDEAVALVARLGQASASLIQRHLRIGYNRAARLLEVMEREGVVGPADGSRPREVYVKDVPGPPFR